jgi:hypothetical protein
MGGLLAGGRLAGARRPGDRALELLVPGDPFALNVRLGAEISARGGALFELLRSTDRTLDLERKIVVGHVRLLPRIGRKRWSIEDGECAGEDGELYGLKPVPFNSER